MEEGTSGGCAQARPEDPTAPAPPGLGHAPLLGRRVHSACNSERSHCPQLLLLRQGRAREFQKGTARHPGSGLAAFPGVFTVTG